jgi:vancomycin resistance protein YoaR
MAARMTAGMGWTGGFVGCIALAAVALTVTGSPEAAPATAPDGATLCGVPVAGKSPDEVRAVAGELSKRLLAYPLAIRFGKHSSRFTPARLGGTVDTRTAADAVFAPAPGGNLFERIKDKLVLPPPREIALPVKLTEAAVTRALTRFSIRVGAESKNARLTKIDGHFKAFPPQPGRELDPASILKAVPAALAAPEFRTRLAASMDSDPDRAAWLKAQAPLPITAASREARPRISLDDLKPITATLASFTTNLGGSSRNRVHNVSLACKAVDGTVLLPGDVFSYNDVVGPRVPSAGFREAPVIIKGKLEKGTGGGICQVSSTLYNAVLLADLEIVRRSHHAFPVHYLPAGRDATVVDGAIDFRFKNRLAHPVAIDAKVVGGRVVMSLYGHPDDKREVEIVSSHVSRIPAGMKTVSDPRLARGRRIVEERAKIGRRVTVSRVVKKDGTVLRNEVISHDYYRPFDGVVRVGTRVAVHHATPRPAAAPGAAPAAAPAPAASTPAAATTPGG